MGTAQKRKLIFLWTYTNWGGPQVYLQTIMSRASDFWDQVVVLPRTSSRDVTNLLDQHGIRYEFLRHHFVPSEEPTFVGKLRRQYERVRSEVETFIHLMKYDLRNSVLHIEIAPWQSWILLAMLALRGGNVFTTLNNFRPEAPRWRKLVWRLRFQVISRLPGFHIFASNKDAKESLKEWLTPEYWKTVEVAYSPIDPEQIERASNEATDPRELRDLHGIAEDDFVVLAVGQFIDRKGRWTFLDAARRALAADPSLRFVWLMPAPIEKEDKTKIESYGLGDRFMPVLSSSIGTDRISILQFFRIADAFALPSFVEGLPIALIEAMALKVPVISTNVYAIPEAVIPEKTGILIEPGDSESLTRWILRLKADPDLRNRLAEDGSRFAIKNFDARIMASTYLESYRKCFDA